MLRSRSRDRRSRRSSHATASGRRSGGTSDRNRDSSHRPVRSGSQPSPHREAQQAVPVTPQWRVLIEGVYASFNPAKVTDVPRLLQKYAGQEKELYRLICCKYGLLTSQDVSAPMEEASTSFSPKEDESKKLKCDECQLLAVEGKVGGGCYISKWYCMSCWNGWNVKEASQVTPQLPEGWTEVPMPDGRVLYFHAASKASSWTWPDLPSSIEQKPPVNHEPVPPTNEGPKISFAACKTLKELEDAVVAWNRFSQGIPGGDRVALTAIFKPPHVKDQATFHECISAMGVNIPNNAMAGLPSPWPTLPSATVCGDQTQPGLQVVWSNAPDVKSTIQYNTKQQTVTVKAKRTAFTGGSGTPSRIDLLLTFLGKPLRVVGASGQPACTALTGVPDIRSFLR